MRRRWIAAGAALVALFALIGVFFGIKIGLASSDSLAKNGPAYDALADPGEAAASPTGTLTPMEVLVSTDQAHSTAAGSSRKVDGVQSRVRPDRTRAATATARRVVVRRPDDGDGELPERRRRQAGQEPPSTDLPGVVGVAGVGAAQIDFLHAVYGNFPLMLLIIAVLTFMLLVRAFRSLLLPLKAVLLNLVSLAATLGLMVLFWQDGHGSQRDLRHPRAPAR